MKMNSDSLFATLKAKRREAAAETVFQAAEQVIVDKGFEGATMQDIARRAGCAAGTLYLYFRNKEDLISLLLGRHMRRMEKLFRDAVGKSEDGLVRLKKGFQTCLDYCHQHHLVLRVYFSTNSSPDMESQLKGEAREAYANMKALDIESIRRAQQSGQVRADIAPEELVEFIYGLFNSALARWFLRGKGSDAKAQLELIWSFLVQGLGAENGTR